MYFPTGRLFIGDPDDMISELGTDRHGKFTDFHCENGSFEWINDLKDRHIPDIATIGRC